MAEFASINLAKLGAELAAASRSGRTRTNPRRPSELVEIYQQIASMGVNALLSADNPKTKKGWKSKYQTAILHFASADTARKVVRNDPNAFGYTEAEAKKVKNVCPAASPGCLATCLVGSGRGGMGSDVDNFKINSVTNARIRRQLLMEKNAEAFFTLLIIEIAQGIRKARKMGWKYTIRLNGTSDIDWENIPVRIRPALKDFVKKQYGVTIPQVGKVANIFKVFPRFQFYDYTKVVPRMRRYLEGRLPRNYYLTFSLAEKPQNNRTFALELLLTKKANVAVPFDTPPSKGGKEWPLPEVLGINVGRRSGETAWFNVFDADQDDLRFLDPKRHGLGKIAGLRFKLPTDKSKKQKIEATDFRLNTKGQMQPIIGLSGNVLNPGPGWAAVKKAARKRSRLNPRRR